VYANVDDDGHLNLTVVNEPARNNREDLIIVDNDVDVAGSGEMLIRLSTTGIG
jgi:hypothetical protein